MTARSRHLQAFVAWIGIALSGCAQMPAADTGEEARTYSITYTVAIDADEDEPATASIEVTQPSRWLREMRFAFDPDRYSDFGGDGTVTEHDGQVTWEPPRRGGTLTYKVRISNQRGFGGYDALQTRDWALFRAGDVFPPAATRTVVGAEARARLDLELPDGWSALTPYLTGNGDLSFPVDNPDRRFDRPTGWIVAGKIGVRRNFIAGTRVAIGAPEDQGVERMEIMAFMRWTLPTLRQVFPTLDPRIIVVSAADPMWRGGLSGPASLYVHADRPMISENGTSTMLHELVHVAMGIAGDEHDDWVVEGLAEYYSIKILNESGTMSRRRMELALEDLREWGESVDNLFVRNSTGPVTARAATVMAELDAWIEEQTRGRRGLDDVVRQVIDSDQPYSYRSLCMATRAVARRAAPLLLPAAVPGAPAESECSDTR